ncbi:MAG: 16S rRNA (uracil(1498)-N(3))-methyltransferase, partial [Xanthobacteraceae bacterium]|nr:16S rRNA (uracil(1498)-N(3))-methyltransferase [Xanthobacteraceae bacterium]
GVTVALDAAQGHYLGGVLRLAAGDHVLAFNGTDGEWLCAFIPVGKKRMLAVERQARAQTSPGDLHYLFAPLKRARLDYMVQKAVEMGVSRLAPVISRHTQADRINLERMRANAIEAAEQCGILSLPEITPPVPLERAIATMAPERHLVFCDEEAPAGDPMAVLASDLSAGGPAAQRRPLALLIGPEGGFDPSERAVLLRRPNTSRIALGPRILRADTAAVAALAIVQAAAGDWRDATATKPGA